MCIKEPCVLGVLSLVLISCATVDVNNPYIDSALAPYVESFKEEGVAEGVDVDITQVTVIFGTLQQSSSNYTILGECEYDSHSHVITIDPKYWSVLADSSKEELVFHELGHCVLNRGHCNAKDGEQRFSIMEAYMGSPSFYDAHKADLMHELFHPDPRCAEAGRDGD